jgi:hypothetical protein
MDGNDLILILEVFRETVPVSRPAKFLPFGTGVASLFKAG